MILQDGRRQAMDQEKIFAKDISDKGLLSKIDTALLKLNSKKNKQSKFKTGKRLEQTLRQTRQTGSK